MMCETCFHQESSTRNCFTLLHLHFYILLILLYIMLLIQVDYLNAAFVQTVSQMPLGGLFFKKKKADADQPTTTVSFSTFQHLHVVLSVTQRIP